MMCKVMYLIRGYEHVFTPFCASYSTPDVFGSLRGHIDVTLHLGIPGVQEVFRRGVIMGLTYTCCISVHFVHTILLRSLHGEYRGVHL